MSEPLDTLIRDHIFDVFEQYEDASADAGWDLLRQRFPDKKKDRVILWWFGTAATLLFFAGLFLLLNKKEGNLVYHSAKRPKQEIIARSGSVQNNNTPIKGEQKDPRQETKPWSGKSSALQVYTYQKPRAAIPAVINIKSPILTPNNERPAEVLSGKPSGGSFLATVDNSRSVKPLNEINILPDTAKGNNSIVFNTEKKQGSTILPAKPADPVLKMMADDKARQPKVALTEKLPKKKSIIELSPYAATYFNYAKGSSNQVNVGAGVTTDFKISGNFKFSTGISVAQNTLSFNNGDIPQQAAASAGVYASATIASSSSASNAFVNSYNLNNYKANLIGLDIPINFKYQFNPAKTDTYVSAGISSGTFINESYSTTIQYTNFANANSTQLSTQHFGTFDFAKTVNFSFGVGYPVGGNRLIVEPFLKYPIGGLGSQNIRFGASGVNFKFNFSTTKK